MSDRQGFRKAASERAAAEDFIAEARERVVDTVTVPRKVVEDVLWWAREIGGPAYDERELWCKPIADLARYVEDS